MWHRRARRCLIVYFHDRIAEAAVPHKSGDPGSFPLCIPAPVADNRHSSGENMSWEKDLQRWVDAQLVDAATADRIRQFEGSAGHKRWRWPAVLAVGFGALMLCAGILLFVAAHWDELSPTQRFMLVLGMTAVFHVAAGLLGDKVPAIGTALHVAGTATLGAGIFLAAQ